MVYSSDEVFFLKTYRTIKGYSEAEYEISKSRFIAYVNKTETVDDAISFVNRIKKQHWNATHNCSAYCIGKNSEIQKADDDGEPSGTAGIPILDVLKKAEVKDTVIVVTRYFGGIKLGAGGLIRAYGKGATLGLKASGLVERVLHTQFAIEVDYTFLGTIENQLRSSGYIINDKEFGEKVTIYTLAEFGYEELLENTVVDLTAGRARITTLDTIYVDKEIDC